MEINGKTRKTCTTDNKLQNNKENPTTGTKKENIKENLYHWKERTKTTRKTYNVEKKIAKKQQRNPPPLDINE